MNRIGKFETLQLLLDFDAKLIERFGINMTDAHITRYEVLELLEAWGSVDRAVIDLAHKRGLHVPVPGN